MNIKILKKLSRSTKHQLLYKQVKELHLNIFKNNYDYTKLQLLYLHWLSIYDSLFVDLAMNKKYITEEIIYDDIRAEAYLLYRNHKDNKENNESSDTIDTVITKRESNSQSIIFI